MKAQSNKVQGLYWILPLISASTWFVTLIIHLTYWFGVGQPQYESQEGRIAFISDVGAQQLKPLFVIGTIITSITFVLTLGSLLYLQSPRTGQNTGSPSLALTNLRTITRLPGYARKSETALAWLAFVWSIVGGAGLILLAGFDTLRYANLHRLFLAVFMFGVVLSAIFTCIQFWLSARSHRSSDPEDARFANRAAVIKGVVAIVLLGFAVAFSVRLATSARGNGSAYDSAAILEWVIAFGFCFYLLTFVYDLRHVRPRNDSSDYSSFETEALTVA